MFVLSVTSSTGLLYACTPLENLQAMSMLYIVIFQIVQLSSNEENRLIITRYVIAR